MLKEVDELEKEKERLASDLQDSSKTLSELRSINEKLEDKVKSLTSGLERSNNKLQSFLSGTKKLDNPLRMNKPIRDRQYLGCVKSDNCAVSISKITFVPSSNRMTNTANLEPKGNGVLGKKTSTFILEAQAEACLLMKTHRTA